MRFRAAGIVVITLGVMALIYGGFLLATANSLVFAMTGGILQPAILVSGGIAGLLVGTASTIVGVGRFLQKTWSRMVGLFALPANLVYWFVLVALAVIMLTGNIGGVPGISLSAAGLYPISPWLYLVPSILLAALTIWQIIAFILNRDSDVAIDFPSYSKTTFITNTNSISGTFNPSFGLPDTVIKNNTVQPKRSVPMERTKIMSDDTTITAWLVINKGDRAGKKFDLREVNNIGRHQTNCSVVLTDGLVSSEHARIKLEGNQFYLYDLASSNGTYLNGKRLEKREVLVDNDVIKVGDTNLTFKRVG